MEKIKKVGKYDYYTEQRSDHWKSDVHAVRHTGIDVQTENGDIRISNADIRNYFGGAVKRVSLVLLEQIITYLLETRVIDPKNPLEGFKRK